jgi:hypothetical protein
MLIDLRVILNGPMAIIIAVVLTSGAIFGKWLAALFTQIILKFSKAQRQLLFGLSTAHAGAILAVVLVGYKAGILDENILNGTIILILISCLVASVATEKASKKILLTEKSSELSVSEINLQNDEHILLPIVNLINIEKLLEFTLLIKDKKSANPVTILTVVPNNAEAELNIITAREKLKEFKKHGAASEIKVNTIATIDYNPADGITRISRETLSSIIVLGWPKKAGIIDKIIGEKISSIISNIDKTIFICQLEKLLINHKRIIVVTPPLAEKEIGFEIWLQKISILSHELSIPVVYFGNMGTQDAIREKIKQKHLNTLVSFKVLDDLEDLLVSSADIKDDDLLVLISARKYSVSYLTFLDNIPNKIERHFTKNNKIVVYPLQKPG